MTNYVTRLMSPLGLVIWLTLFAFCCKAEGATKVRIKDLCSFQSQGVTELIGYGLVIGLDGTGDGNNTQFTVQSLSNMMERMGLTTDPRR